MVNREIWHDANYVQAFGRVFLCHGQVVPCIWRSVLADYIMAYTNVIYQKYINLNS